MAFPFCVAPPFPALKCAQLMLVAQNTVRFLQNLKEVDVQSHDKFPLGNIFPLEEWLNLPKRR